MNVKKNKISTNYKTKKSNSFLSQELLRSLANVGQQDLLKKERLKGFGLTNNQYLKRLEKFGKNELKHINFQGVKEFFKAYFSPFNIILLVISIYNFIAYKTGTFGTDESDLASLVGAIIVLLMVVTSGTMTFVQSYRGYAVTDKLRRIISNTVNVIRHENGEHELITNIDDQTSLKLIRKGREINVTELVPGDLIYISSGDLISADIRIVNSRDLFVNQSSLTGESLPVEKHATLENQKSDSIFDLDNICFTGTSVVSGSALAVVISTGNKTYFSSIGEMLMQDKKPEGSFLAGVRHVTRTLLIFMFILVPLIYGTYILKNIDAIRESTKLAANPWFTGMFFAISVIVSLTPEMLPMIITTNLSNGAAKLTKEKVVVKRFDAIQSLGAIDVLCTDKTGTLTNDKIEMIGCLTIDKKPETNLMTYLLLNSYFQTGMKNPMDKAIINNAQQNANLFDFALENVEKKFTKVDEIPFDFNRRRLTIVFDGDESGRIMVTKGSVEEVLAVCDKINYQGKVQDLTGDFKRQIKSQYQKMNNHGERVLGVAYTVVDEKQNRYTPNDEQNMIFYGFASFLDTPKESSSKMIKALKKYGVSLKILTGDNEQVTRAICKIVNMDIAQLVTGEEIERATDSELKTMVEKANVFVKLSPIQKVKVLTVLKENGHTVGYMGDGINDAPVLYQADVAISVNNAADIAKEASDIVLLEKDLGVLERGILTGRTVFGNILKYMKITVASQFGNSASVMIATAAFGNLLLAMAPIQSLFQNLIYDFSQLGIAWDNVDEEFLQVPRKWTTKDLVPFAIINGLVSSIFDITNYLIMGYGVGAFENLTHSGQVGNLYNQISSELTNKGYTLQQISDFMNELRLEQIVQGGRVDMNGVILDISEKWQTMAQTVQSNIATLKNPGLTDLLDQPLTSWNNYHDAWEAQFQATAFMVGLSTQACIVHILRTEKLPIIQSRSPWYLYATTGVITLIAFLFAFVPSLGELIKLQSPPVWYIAVGIGILIAYLVLGQLFKMAYIKIFKKWL